MTDTIPARLMKQARLRPDRPAYYIRKDGAWVPTTWKTYVKEVRTAARALIALGLEPEDTVTILGFNRPEWVIFDVAAMAAGGVPAGIYTTCSASEVQYIIDHAEARFVLLENEDQWAKVEAELDNLPRLEHVVMMKGADVDHELVMSWDEFMEKAEGVSGSDLDDRIEALEDEQLATLIYTSGTTGPPKGVMLTHHNLAWTAAVAKELTNVSDADWSLSYLPLSHIAEQMFTIHGPATTGGATYYAESIERVPDNLKEIQPTLFFGVPRIWEKFHAGITAKLSQATGLKAALANWAMGVGREAFQYTSRGEPLPGLLGVKYKLANKLIFTKVREAVGLANVHTCVSGAAPISKEILEFFTGLDIVVNEVYGQSEGSGPTSFNRKGAVRLGTVGPPLPEVEVAIAEDDEVLVKGPNVFKGYFKDPDATAETLIDGWLHSGDLGKFDDEGFLSIIGRKKDIIITAGGKNIAPKNIEASLKNHTLITEAVVIGDRRKFLSALICLDPDAAVGFAKENGIDASAVHEHDKTHAAVQRIVDEVNKEFARVEQIKKFTILERPLTVEDGELTPTLKVKRRIVNDHFADEIEAMYQD